VGGKCNMCLLPFQGRALGVKGPAAGKHLHAAAATLPPACRGEQVR